jgi:hypothetical protein
LGVFLSSCLFCFCDSIRYFFPILLTKKKFVLFDQFLCCLKYCLDYRLCCQNLFVMNLCYLGLVAGGGRGRRRPLEDCCVAVVLSLCFLQIYVVMNRSL